MRNRPVAFLLVLSTASGASAAITHVSTDALGVGQNARASDTAVSDDGRWVAFRGWDDLAAGFTTQMFKHNVYVKDLQTGGIVTIDVAPGGGPTNGDARAVSISSNGRFVAFYTEANNLVTPAGRGIVLHDRDPDGNGTYDEGNGTSVLASRRQNGEPSWPLQIAVDVSGDGRFVAFQTADSLVVANDTNGVDDVFAYDRLTGLTTRVSVGNNGVESNGASLSARFSATGRYVAFQSRATNLVSGQIWQYDIFRRDRDPDGNGQFDEGNGIIERASTAWNSSVGSNLDSISPDISADGDTVVFASGATNLGGGFTFSDSRIFVRRMSIGGTTLVSVNNGFESAITHTRHPRISADGGFVVFDTSSSNLVAGDNNGMVDVFVRDLVAFRTTRISNGLAGAEPDRNCEYPDVSGDGAVIGWHSQSTNLAVSDTLTDSDVFADAAWSPACPVAAWSNYGNGLGGTLGVPGLTGSGSSQLGGTFTLQIGNSRGADTPALLIVGTTPTAIPSLSGTLLVQPTWVVSFVLPAAGVGLPAAIPNDNSFCGGGFLVQVFESDPGASSGVSISRGIAVTLGL